MPIESLRVAENAAFAIQRSLPQYEIRVDELISLSRRLLTEALHDAPDREELDEDAWESHNRRKFDSAARVIAGLARTLSDENGDRANLLVLSAIGFCLDGNQVAARLVGREALGRPGVPEWLSVALGVSCPLLAVQCLGHVETGDAVEVLQAAHASIALPGDYAEVLRRRLLAYSQTFSTPGMGYFFGFALRANQRAVELRFDRVLEGTEFPLKQPLLEGLAVAERYLALPSQRAALSEAGVLAGTAPGLISLPTGAGKTLVGLTVLLSALREPTDLAVFIAPYLAIRRQVVELAQKIVGAHIDVVGGAEGAIRNTRPTLVVDTPEAFDRRIRRDPTLATRLRAVVLDEAHLLGSSSRGLVVDGLLTRLAIAESSANPPKVTLLSAILDDSSAVKDWLTLFGEQPVHIVSRWRPAARRVGIWRGNGRLEWLRIMGANSDRARVMSIASDRIEPVFPQLSLSHPLATRGPRFDECNANAALLATALWRQDHSKTLVVTGTRLRARHIAASIAGRLEERTILPATCERLLGEIDRDYKEYSDLKALIARGVAYHSAALPLRVRSLIEVACALGELEFVCATTTLAEGADLPFGRTILADWSFSIGEDGHQAFSPALWRNIAGRCGRPSTHIEGETVLIEETPAVRYRYRQPRSSVLHQMLIGRVELESPLSAEGEVRRKVLEQLTSQAIAAVKENPETEDIHHRLSRSLLASHVAQVGAFRELEAYLERRLLSGPNPLAVRRSPLRLTSKGEAVVVSSLLPDAAAALYDALPRIKLAETAGALCDAILRTLAESADLHATAILQIYAGRNTPGLWIKAEEIGDVCESWLRGASVRDLLLSLGNTRSRTTRSKFAQLELWLDGQLETEEWRLYHEKLQEFCRVVLADTLVRALQTLNEMALSLSDEILAESVRPVLLAARDAARDLQDADD